MSFNNNKEYHREWMRKFREENKRSHEPEILAKKKEKLLSEGKCPNCELLLTSVYHINCSYLTELHKKIDNN